jgi:hypothetical protein
LVLNYLNNLGIIKRQIYSQTVASFQTVLAGSLISSYRFVGEDGDRDLLVSVGYRITGGVLWDGYGGGLREGYGKGFGEGYSGTVYGEGMEGRGNGIGAVEWGVRQGDGCGYGTGHRGAAGNGRGGEVNGEGRDYGDRGYGKGYGGRGNGIVAGGVRGVSAGMGNMKLRTYNYLLMSTNS